MGSSKRGLEVKISFIKLITEIVAVSQKKNVRNLPTYYPGFSLKTCIFGDVREYSRVSQRLTRVLL